VEPGRIDDVAAVVSAHPGVSHNYSRDHFYNLWFTLTLAPEKSLESEIDYIAAEAGVEDTINLPSQRRFKLGVHFDMSRDSDGEEDEQGAATYPSDAGAKKERYDEGQPIDEQERKVIQVLQGDMPVVPRPFSEAAQELGLSEETLLRIARDLDEQGVMRRFSAVLKHRRAGYTANGMGCWVVPEDEIVEAGRKAAAFAAVSHCYERPARPPRWPYNLFTMVHGQSRDEVEEIVARINREIGPFEHRVLYSEKEYKKERVKYFVEDEAG
jgi:DNA-binding Lrp family transcriptional regulator